MTILHGPNAVKSRKPGFSIRPPEKIFLKTLSGSSTPSGTVLLLMLTGISLKSQAKIYMKTFAFVDFQKFQPKSFQTKSFSNPPNVGKNKFSRELLSISLTKTVLSV